MEIFQMLKNKSLKFIQNARLENECLPKWDTLSHSYSLKMITALQNRFGVKEIKSLTSRLSVFKATSKFLLPSTLF